MRSATGTYELDSALAGFFGAKNLRLIHRDPDAIGKLGRRFGLRGRFDGLVLHAHWRGPAGAGWIVLHFDASFVTFEGTYGDGAGSSLRGHGRGRLRAGRS